MYDRFSLVRKPIAEEVCLCGLSRPVNTVKSEEHVSRSYAGSGNAVKDIAYRRMDWPSRDSTVHFQPIFQRLGNPSLRWDGLPIRGMLTGRHNIGCGWANPSYISRPKNPSRRCRKGRGSFTKMCTNLGRGLPHSAHSQRFIEMLAIFGQFPGPFAHLILRAMVTSHKTKLNEG